MIREMSGAPLSPSCLPLNNAESDDDFDEEFSIDELAVINGLLAKATNEVASPPLALADLGEHEGAHQYSATWPGLGKGDNENGDGSGIRERVIKAVPKVKVQYEYDEDNELSLEDWIGVSAGGRLSLSLFSIPAVLSGMSTH